jgi:hypothetical protein
VLAETLLAAAANRTNGGTSADPPSSRVAGRNP